MTRNQKEIKLFGETLILHARDASDTFVLTDFVEKHFNDDKRNGILVLCTAIRDALKYNIKEYDKSFKESNIKNFLVKVGLFKKYYARSEEIKSIKAFNSKLTTDYIFSNLSIQQLNDVMMQIGELEGMKFEVDSDTEKKS